MIDTVRSSAITAFHDACLARSDWPADDAGARTLLPDASALAEAWGWVLVNHRFNCSLWNEEDLARRTRAADAEIAANKRHIDRFNQARNDAMERIDDALLRATADWPRREDARLSSETAGAMIDRMSILALKIHHMGLQTVRTDVDETHRETTRAKVAQLRLQRDDLASCYDRLLDEIATGTGRFKIYRQFKMYNDPTLNPVLVAERQRAGARGG
ncbi:MAG: hypothetical protein RJA99_679 [Pseudomonadota bacterium]|jgi:hypothetical protein